VFLLAMGGAGCAAILGIEDIQRDPPSKDLLSSDGGPPGRGDAAGPGDAGCVPTVIDDALSTIDVQRWLPAPSMGGFPKADPNPPGMPKPMIALITPMTAHLSGGLWLSAPVPTHAFDVTFDYFVDCPNPGDAYNSLCADGLAVAWIDTKNALDLAGGKDGNSLALPTMRGGAVTITVAQNDKQTPVTLAIRTITTVAPGSASKSITNDSLVKRLNTAAIRLRNGKVAVTVRGLGIEGSTASDFVGYFGFTAATGDAKQGAYVSSFHGEFYDCDPAP
jgi:hypothetical protein